MASKAHTITKIQTLYALWRDGFLNNDEMQETVRSMLAGGLRQLPESSLAGQPDDLVEFAREFGLVKARGTRSTALGRGAQELIEAQYPDARSDLEAVNRLRSRVFEINTPQGTKKVKFIPFFRDVSQKVPAEVNI